MLSEVSGWSKLSGVDDFVRIKVIDDGRVIREVQLPEGCASEEVERVSREHSELCKQVAAAGRPWLVELRFFDGDTVIFGSNSPPDQDSPV